MQGLVAIVSLAVIGVSMAAAFPTDFSPADLHRLQLRATGQGNNNRKAHCSSDRSYLFSYSEPNGLSVTDAVCNCTYMNDNREGQDGSSMSMDWFQNRTCRNISFLDMVIGPMQRRAWEIQCQCKEYTPASSSECEISQLPNRWTRCFVFPNSESPQYDDDFCSEIVYEDGTRGKAATWCSIPGPYDWGR